MGLLTQLIDDRFKKKDEERQNKVTSYKAVLNDPNAEPAAKEWALQQMLGETGTPKGGHEPVMKIFKTLLGFGGSGGQKPDSGGAGSAQVPSGGAMGTPGPAPSLKAKPPSRFFQTDEEAQARQGKENEFKRGEERKDIPVAAEKAGAVAEAQGKVQEGFREPPSKTTEDGTLIQWDYNTKKWSPALMENGQPVRIMGKPSTLKPMQDPADPSQQIYGREVQPGVIEPVRDSEGNTVPVKAVKPPSEQEPAAVKDAVWIQRHLNDPDPQVRAAAKQMLKKSEGAAGGAEGDTAPIIVDTRPDAKTGKTVVPGTGLTRSSIYQSGKSWALTGVMPSLGLGSAGSVKNARAAIINSGSALAENSGVDLPALRAEYKSNAAALTKLVGPYTQLEVNATNAANNFEILKSLGQEMDAKSVQIAIPLLNSYVRSGQVSLSGNKAVNNFMSTLTEAMTEYAKVVTGQTGGAAVTDAARKQVQDLLNRGLSTSAINDWVEKSALPLMDSRKSSYLAGINAVSGTIASFLNGGPVEGSGGGAGGGQRGAGPNKDPKSMSTDDLLKALQQ